MSNLNILIIEDSEAYAQAIKHMLKQELQQCTVRILNPSREHPPTFEAFFEEIEEATKECGLVKTVVLLDNHLGRWRWKGANIAPSLHNVISISSEKVGWAKFCFQAKAQLTDGEPARTQELLDEIMRISAPFRKK